MANWPRGSMQPSIPATGAALIAAALHLYTRSAHHVRGAFSASPTTNVCKRGRLLPEFYLLGAQKSATSSLALDLIRLGVKPYNVTHSGDKEVHFFDGWGRPMNTEEGFTGLEASWLDTLPPCDVRSRRQVIADYTPSNLRTVILPAGTNPTGSHWGMWYQTKNEKERMAVGPSAMNLPQTISRLYAEQAKRITFVVMLREPLARMQSAWYHSAKMNWRVCRDCRAPSFQKALVATMGRMRQQPPRLDDWLWGSMYSLHLEQWMAHFPPNQFFVIPFKAYVGGNKKNICQKLSWRLDFKMNCGSLRNAVAANSHEHPVLEDDLPGALRHQFHELMHTEVTKLMQVLAWAYTQGTGLSGFETTKSPDEVMGLDVWDWIKTQW